MSERVLRLIIGGVMSATLFLRWDPLSDGTGYSNSFFICWTSYGVLSTMELGLADLVDGFGIVLFLQAIPLFILFNVCLAIHPSSRLKKLYRILVWILFPLAWYESLVVVDPVLRGTGFWAHTLVISAAALIEVVLLVKERMGQQERNMGSQENLDLH